MTFGQMQALFWQRIDQSGSPSFTSEETDRLLNWAYDVWYIINRKKFDTDQANSVNMTYLIRPFTFFNTKQISVVGTGTNIPDYRDLAKMGAAFNHVDCNGVTTTVFKNVVPVPISVIDTNRNDPYNKPTDDYPMYYQTHDTANRLIQVECTTNPIFLNGNYFKELQVIDAQNSPNTQFEAQDYIARQVIGLTKILAKGDLDDYPAVKEAMAESALTMMA